MTKLILSVKTENNFETRRYSINFDETEGDFLNLKIGEHDYILDINGKLKKNT